MTGVDVFGKPGVISVRKDHSKYMGNTFKISK